MAAADYRLCDKCKAKTFYDSDVDYEDSNLGAMAALCKDCAQTHEITIAKRGEIAELRAALEAAERALDRAGASLLHDNYEQQERAYKKLQAAHDEVRAALAATEGGES